MKPLPQIAFLIIFIFALFTLVIIYLKKKKQVKIDSKQHLLNKLISASSRDGYILLDNELNILQYNQYVLTYFRLSESDLTNRKIIDLFDEFKTLDFQLMFEFVLTQNQVFEFEIYIQEKAAWYNLKLLNIEQSYFIVYLFENTLEKIEVLLSETERDVLEDFSKQTITFFEIFAKAMDRFQDQFKGTFFSAYLLNDTKDELYFFSSGYYHPIATVPKPIKDDFLGFQFLIKNELIIDQNNLYFNYLSELFTLNDFTIIYSSPFKSEITNTGVFFLHTKQRKEELKNIIELNKRLNFFVKKIFDYHAIFREIEKLSIVSENALKAFATINLKSEITWTNKAFNKLFNATKEEIYLKPILNILSLDNIQAKLFDEIQKGISVFQQIDIKIDYKLKNGSIKYLHLFTKKIFAGDHIQLLIEIDDITEQITYQRLIEESHDFLNKITAKVPIVLFQYTINAHRNIHFTFISQELERLFSTMTIENFYDKPNSIFEIIHPLDKLKLFKKYLIACHSLSNFNCEIRFKNNHSKHYDWVNISCISERTLGGEVEWFGFLENITDKKEKIKKIEDANVRFNYVSKAVNELIVEIDLEENNLKWGNAIESIFGYNKNKRPNLKEIKSIIHPEDYDQVEFIFTEAIKQKSKELLSIEYRMLKADKTYLFVLLKAYILRNPKTGIASKIIGSIKDVSESKLFEKQKKELINETQSFERNQFSMELHDGLAQQLVALNLYLTQLECDISERNIDRYQICKQLVMDSLNQTRTLCYTVSPPELADGLIKGIHALFERMNRLNGITFHFQVDEILKLVNLENIDNYNIYRIIQEFTNNSIKHSSCEKITCSMNVVLPKKKLMITIEDNGIGFDFEKVKFGFGIQNMRKRASLANAKFNISSKIGTGSRLTLELSV